MSTESSKPNNDNQASGSDERLVAGAEQQVGAGEQLEARAADADDPRTTQQGHALDKPQQAQPGSVSSGADPDREMPSAAEAEDRGGEEQRLKDDEEAAELDDALDDTFPASDPPAQTSKGKAK